MPLLRKTEGRTFRWWSISYKRYAEKRKATPADRTPTLENCCQSYPWARKSGVAKHCRKIGDLVVAATLLDRKGLAGQAAATPAWSCMPFDQTLSSIRRKIIETALAESNGKLPAKKGRQRNRNSPIDAGNEH